MAARSSTRDRQLELTRCVLEKSGYFALREKHRRDRKLSRSETMDHLRGVRAESEKPLFGFAKVSRRLSAMEARFTESPEVRAEIEAKAARTAVLFNKGGYGYVTDFDGTRHLGRK